MAAGDGTLSINNDLSYLQTPTYQLVTIFVILIVLSLIIEKFISRMRKRIDLSGSKGMMHALEAALNELVLLGFISFMLEIFGPEISKICIDMYGPNSVASWFARCPVNYIAERSSQQLYSQSCTSAYEATYSVKTSAFDRFFKTEFDGCSDDKQPFASQQALHEIHYLLFLIGIIRILAIVAMVYASHSKLRQWDEDMKKMKVIRTIEGIISGAGQAHETSEVVVDADGKQNSDEAGLVETEKKVLETTSGSTNQHDTTNFEPEVDSTFTLSSSRRPSDVPRVRAFSDSETERRKTIALDHSQLIAKVLNDEIEVQVAAEVFQEHPKQSSPESESNSWRGGSSRRGSNASVTGPSSSDEYLSEQEMSWLRISNLQTRRMSVEFESLKSIATETSSARSMIQRARELSILTSQAEAAAIKAAAEERGDDSSSVDTIGPEGASPTIDNPYARKVSTIDEDHDYLSQKGHVPLEIQSRDRSETVQAVIDSGFTEKAVKAAGKKREEREFQKQETLGKPRGWRKYFFFLVPDVTRTQIIKKKTAAFVDKLVEERRRLESKNEKAKLKRFNSRTMNIDRRESTSLTDNSIITSRSGILWSHIKSTFRKLFYLVHLQALLFMRQFTHGVTRGDVDESRKSFIRKHHLPCDFNFLAYTRYTVDEDLADVIIVHWIEWVVGLVYLFGVGIDDAFALQFWIPVIAIVLMSMVGLQIQMVMFHVAALRIDDQHTTDSHFWFGKPRNMLWMLRISTSIFSFTLAFTYFVVWKEGLNSCYFNLWDMSWGWVLYHSLFTLGGLAYIGYILLPQYSLAVEMGSYYRKDVLKQIIVANKLKKSSDEAEDLIKRLERQRAQKEPENTVTNTKATDVASPSGSRELAEATDSASKTSEKDVKNRAVRSHSALVRIIKQVDRTPSWCRNAAAVAIQTKWREAFKKIQEKQLEFERLNRVFND